MSEDNLSANISYRFSKITTQQFAIIEDVYNSEDEVNVKWNLGFNCLDGTFIVNGTTRFEFLTNQNTPFIIVEVKCDFDIITPDPDMVKNNTIVKLPKVFGINLLSIMIGVTRGIMHAKTENTIFNKYIVPLIKLEEFVTDDISLIEMSNPLK